MVIIFVGILLLALSVGMGASLIRLVPIKLFRLEWAAAAVVLGLFASAWIVFLITLALGYGFGLPVAAAAMLAIALAGTFNFKNWRGRKLRLRAVIFRHGGPSKRARAIWWAASGALTALLGYLLWTHMLQIKPDGWYTGLATYGDVVLHATLITHFKEASGVDLNMPILNGAHLSYPFLIDFLSGIYYRLGWSLQAALIIPSWLLVAGFFQLLFFAGYRLFGSALAALLGVLLFCFNGSLGGIGVFWKDLTTSNQGLWHFLGHLPQDYSNLSTANLRFSNVISTQLLPQRGTMLAYPVFCLFLILIIEAWRMKRGKSQRRTLVGATVLAGLMPMVHAHTALLMLVVLGWFGLLQTWKQRRLVNAWSLATVAALALCVPQLVWEVFSVHHAAGFTHWHLGWTRLSHQNLPLYWWQTFGLGFLFAVGLPWALYWRSKEALLWRLYVPFLAFFVVANMYILQPWDYDNFKLIALAFMGISLYAGYYLARLARKGAPGIAVVAVVVAVMCLPGVLSVAKELQSSYMVFSNSDIKLAQWTDAHTAPKAVFAMPDAFNQPVTALAGRTAVLGYRAWLWSYGLDYAPAEQQVGQILGGEDPAKTALQKSGASYVVLADDPNWTINRAYFESHYSLAYTSDDGRYQIFDVNRR